ncbi:MAG: serine hydrolase [Planctomycetaceae bacterium]
MAACTVLAQEQKPSGDKPPTKFGSREHRIVDELFADFSGSRPGASILIARGQHVLFAKSYGQANRETGVPVSVSANFRIASVSKQFTAAAERLRCLFRTSESRRTTICLWFLTLAGVKDDVTL